MDLLEINSKCGCKLTEKIKFEATRYMGMLSPSVLARLGLNWI